VTSNASMATTNAPAQAAKEEERSMVRGVVAGDRAEFERLMRKYNQRLFRIARATLRDDAEAEDALQEAYLAAYRSIGKFRGDAALSTWLSRLVLNECLGRLRRGARRRKVVPIVSAQDEMDAVSAPDSKRPERVVARRQLRALLERKLDELPESFRLVFVLRSVEELSVEETARCLGIPDATVRTRYFRARTRLREALAQEFELAEQDLFDFGGARCARVVDTVLQSLGNVPRPS
jgi:RNA polymerase sigma factor (sigma-70 family)